MTPDVLEGLPENIVKQFRLLEERVMSDVIRRLRNNGKEIIRSADWQLYRLQELGLTESEIRQYIKDALDVTDEELDSIYDKVIEYGFSYDDGIYKGLDVSDKDSFIQLAEGIRRQTDDEFSNITQTTGFAIDKNGKISYSSVTDVLDGAMLDISSGLFDYNTVLKRVVEQMTNSGLRTIDYASGWSNRVDVAARRAIMTGVAQLTGKINESNAEKLGTETFEVSWHSGARPSHLEWQGKWYTRNELVSICGLGTVTGLLGANCYHSYSPVIPGISEPTYTAEQLERMKREELTPKEYGGKKYTKYEALQKQRRMETTMRAQRQKIKLLEEGGADEDDIINARCRYRGTSAEYARFSKAMDLPQQRERVTVDGLGDVGKGKYKRKSSGVELNRRKTGNQGQEIIDRPTYQKLTRKFIKNGGIIIRGVDAEKHLGERAYASYLPGFNAAFIRDDATVSDVLEEMYHAEQDRTHMYGNVLTDEVRLRREIDAQKYLTRVAKKYKIPVKEQEVTLENLADYERQLKELLEG